MESDMTNVTKREVVLECGNVMTTLHDDQGRLHSPDVNSPAVVHQYPDGSVYLRQWYSHGLMHSIDGEPSLIQQFADGSTKMVWHTNGVIDRKPVGRPAVIYIGTYSELQFWVDGKLHNDIFPALMFINHRTNLWFDNGKLNRKDGPAIEHNGEPRGWFINGQRVLPFR